MCLYFKCNKCGYIYYKDNKKFVKDPNIQNKYHKEIDCGTCNDCIDYIIWELKEYP